MFEKQIQQDTKRENLSFLLQGSEYKRKRLMELFE